MVVLNVAVLKLSVTGAEAPSASGATLAEAKLCVATTVSAPLLPLPEQFMMRSTPTRRWAPGSTLSVTSIWPFTFARFAGTDVFLPEGAEAAAIERLVALEKDHALLDRPLQVVDMRLPDRLVVRPLPDSHPADGGASNAPHGTPAAPKKPT